MTVHCGVVNITTDEILDELTKKKKKNRKMDLLIYLKYVLLIHFIFKNTNFYK
jgi:hypothetical protein